jgi:hypothetical protein
MGAKTWMLVYSTANAREALAAKPALDREATLKFAAELFPNDKLEQIEDGNLAWTNPPNREMVVGCFPGVAVVAAKEFGGDYPSRLPQAFIDAGRDRTIYLHAMHSVVDWFAFAVWSKGVLVRALSVSPDSGVMENIGEKLPFETPFWAGERPLFDEEDDEEVKAEARKYPLPFHPLDLGEAALLNFFGYQLEGNDPQAVLDPEAIPLVRFRRIRSWWKFW